MFVHGLLTVLMIPILFWFMRRGENAIQFWFHVRAFAKLPSKNAETDKSHHFLESIVTIPQRCQISWYSKGLKQKLQSLFGLVLSKMYFFGGLSLWIYGLEQIRSDGFSCRNLKDGADFLLRNDTQPAGYLHMSFSQIFEILKENGEDTSWRFDKVNGLLSDYWKHESVADYTMTYLQEVSRSLFYLQAKHICYSFSKSFHKQKI